MTRPAAEEQRLWDTIVVGAGLSGLGMAIGLKRAGRDDFVVLEQGSDVGGVWRDHDFPGLCSDVPAKLYSYSFAPNPAWSHTYSTQAEIWAYLRQCVARFGLAPHLRPHSRVVRAAFDEARAHWEVTTSDGTVRHARALVLAVGVLGTPALPALPGLDAFEGRVFHSARWDHGHDLTGRRVAVIGTGASAVQFVPRIAEQAARVYLFQRTPGWVLPKPNLRQRGWASGLFARWPAAQWPLRAAWYWLFEATYPALGRLVPGLLRVGEVLARAHLRRQVRDPALRRRLRPAYALGCKRILFSNDFYPTLCRPDVELVTEPVAGFTADSVRTGDGRERRVDTVIAATGYAPLATTVSIEITGRGGRVLARQWRRGPEAYLGVNVTGFPNLFLVMGPHSFLVHNSLFVMAEAQIRYVLRCLRLLERRGADSLDVTPAAQAAFVDRLRRRGARAVWGSGGCTSWYVGAEGTNNTLWSGSTVGFLLRTLRPRPDHYTFGTSGQR